jgi:hypothetical protein
MDDNVNRFVLLNATMLLISSSLNLNFLIPFYLFSEIPIGYQLYTYILNRIVKSIIVSELNFVSSYGTKLQSTELEDSTNGMRQRRALNWRALCSFSPLGRQSNFTLDCRARCSIPCVCDRTPCPGNDHGALVLLSRQGHKSHGHQLFFWQREVFYLFTSNIFIYIMFVSHASGVKSKARFLMFIFLPVFLTI